jgi:hypothetical protein
VAIRRIETTMIDHATLVIFDRDGVLTLLPESWTTRGRNLRTSLGGRLAGIAGRPMKRRRHLVTDRAVRAHLVVVSTQLRFDPPFGRFVAQLQAHLTIETTHPLGVHQPALPPQRT